MKLPDYYEFLPQPKFVSGKSALEQLSTELQEYGASRPLVLMDGASAAAGLDKKIIKAFYESSIVIGALVTDPPAKAEAGAIKTLTLLFRERGCDSIIAVGSDSVVDIARGLNISLEVPGELSKNAGINVLKKPLRPLFLVMGMKSGGWETGNEVVIDGNLFKSDFLYPDSVIIDSRMLKKVSDKELVNSSMIALTHAVESCAEEVSNPLADAYALSAIQYISENLANVVKSPNDRKGKIALANAYAMAGIVFANSAAGPAHFLSLACAEVAQVPQGIC
ncbi:MAG TPA: iron-containing alcohol dehydrogenase, partial [Spirochaetes bacterium]|nr:iron-containing alcohol dehydrogenase [Spirochaetota bacterium]